MVLFLHNRYRSTGGEERAVEDLRWLVREHLDEPAELLARDSAQLGSIRAAAGLLRGGLAPEEVGRAVRLTHARVLHAHNVLPALGWRALAAARGAGARVVLHLHNYRLVCATGVCFTRGAECTRCHGRDTLPGVRLRCRGSTPEALAYGAGLALWQRRLVEQADVVIVPSVFARERLRALGAPLHWDRVHVLAPVVRIPRARSDEPADGPGWRGWEGAPDAGYALVASRLSAEKGVDVAIEACRMAAIPLVIAGDGPQFAQLRERAGPGVRFVGHVGAQELAALRGRAAIALSPSRSAETFGLALAEAMAAALPVLATRVGAFPELVEEESLVQPGDARAMAAGIVRLAGDREAGARGLARVRARCAPEVIAAGLAALYDGRDADAST